jgi:two-component system, LytTR family, response regulator
MPRYNLASARSRAIRIRTLIVDDEPLGRERVRSLLQDDSAIEIVGECANGKEALASIKKLQPHLLFLDVQMPEMDGFAVLESIPAELLPAVIFVTAYDKYAVRAFQVHALDYLLKSFDRERFHAALARAKKDIEQGSQGTLQDHLAGRLAGLLEDLQARKRYLTRLVIRSAGRIQFLRVEEIGWIEAADNYVRVHAGKESHLLRETLQSLEARLDPQTFLRIHRSTIVNLDAIKELQPLFHGDYQVRLRDATELTLSRSYREKLLAPLGQFL